MASRRLSLRRRSQWAVVVGSLTVLIVGFAVAIASPLAELAHHSFAVHMLQHVLFTLVLPPFFLVSLAAVFGFGEAADGRGRSGAGRTPWGTVGMALRGIGLLVRPVPALVVSTAVLWAWHLPALYELALEDPLMHVLEHASFFVAYLLFWRPLIGVPLSRPVLTSNAARAAYLVAGAMQMAVLGAVITFADRVLYASYLPGTGPFANPLLDQQIGGAIMWFSGPIVFGMVAFLTMDGRLGARRQEARVAAGDEANSTAAAPSIASAGTAPTGPRAFAGSKATIA